MTRKTTATAVAAETPDLRSRVRAYVLLVLRRADRADHEEYLTELLSELRQHPWVNALNQLVQSTCAGAVTDLQIRRKSRLVRSHLPENP